MRPCFESALTGARKVTVKAEEHVGCMPEVDLAPCSSFSDPMGVFGVEHDRRMPPGVQLLHGPVERGANIGPCRAPLFAHHKSRLPTPIFVSSFVIRGTVDLANRLGPFLRHAEL